jgi:hypothetical protein
VAAKGLNASKGPSKGATAANANQGKLGLQGSINAAHASPTAQAQAAPNSRVGLVAAYARAVEAQNVDAAALALTKASNKSISINTVTSLNSLMGLQTDPSTDAAIAAKAASIQSGQSTAGTTGTSSGSTSSAATP